jgi:lipopolysaccharide export system protein LptA
VQPGSAKGAPRPAGPHNDAPVDVDADRIECRTAPTASSSPATSSPAGRADAERGARDARLYRPAASRSSASTRGGVTVRSPSETARGQLAIYDLRKPAHHLAERRHADARRFAVSGGRLVLDLNSGRASWTAAALRAQAPAGTRTQGGRVSGHLHRAKRTDR